MAGVRHLWLHAEPGHRRAGGFRLRALLSSLIGGVVVDAYDRRVVLFASQTVPGLASLGMLAAIATDHVSLGLIYGLVLVTEVASSFESPARQSILPALVPRRLYTRAMTTNSALSSVTSVTGPALGGVLIALGGVGQAYVAHAALVALALIALVPLHLPAVKATGPHSAIRDTGRPGVRLEPQRSFSAR